jgi:hypothetical protein
MTSVEGHSSLLTRRIATGLAHGVRHIEEGAFTRETPPSTTEQLRGSLTQHRGA